MKPSFRSRNSFALAVVALLSAGHASAQSSWNSDTSGNWSDTAKWTGGVPNTPAAVANLTFNITAARTVTIDGTSRTVGTLTIGDTNRSHGYTIAATGGASLILDNGGADASITSTATSINQTISAPILLRSPNTTFINNASGTTTARTLTFTGTISTDTAGAKNISVSGAGNLANVAISGLISDGSGTLSLTKSTSSILTLSGANTFSGGVTIAGGTLLLNHTTAAGSGTLTLSGGAIGTTAGNVTVNNSVAWSNNFGVAGTGTLTLGSALTLGANRSIALTGTGDVGSASQLVTSGAIGGAFSLTTTGSNGVAAILTLNGANTYSGGTAVNGGLVIFGNSLAIPASGNITIGTNGSVSVEGAHTTLAGWLAESRLATSSTGSLALTADSSEAWNPGASGFNSLSLGAKLGTTVEYTGTMTAGTNGYRIGGGGGTIEFSNTNALTGANAVGVGHGGGGTTILSASNDYTGATTVRSGTTLVISNSGALGSSAAGTTVNAGGGIQLTGGVTIVGETLSITGTGSVPSPTNVIAGLSSVSGVNEWTGAINADTTTNVRVSASAGATLRLSGAVTLTGTGSLVLTGAGTGLISGNITGDVVSAGTTATSYAIIQNGGSNWTLTGNNTFVDGVRIDNGSISVASIAANLGTSVHAIGLGETTSAGRLIYTGAGETSDRGFLLRSTDTSGSVGGGVIDQSGTGVLKFNGNVTSSDTTATKTLTLQGSTAGTGEIAGIISNSGTGATALMKSGTGTWTVSGVNTYTGATTVNGGKLIAGGATAGSGVNTSTSIVVTSSGTFELGRSEVVGNLVPMTLNNGTFSTQGFSETLGNLSLTGSTTLALGDGSSVITFSGLTDAAGSALAITGWTGLVTGGGTDQVVFTSGLTAGQLAKIKFVNPNGLTGTFDAAILGNGEIYAVIPESSVAGLILLSACGLVFRRAGRRTSV